MEAKKKRRTYTPEFKAEVVEQIRDRRQEGHAGRARARAERVVGACLVAPGRGRPDSRASHSLRAMPAAGRRHGPAEERRAARAARGGRPRGAHRGGGLRAPAFPPAPGRSRCATRSPAPRACSRGSPRAALGVPHGPGSRSLAARDHQAHTAGRGASRPHDAPTFRTARGRRRVPAPGGLSLPLAARRGRSRIGHRDARTLCGPRGGPLVREPRRDPLRRAFPPGTAPAPAPAPSAAPAPLPAPAPSPAASTPPATTGTIVTSTPAHDHRIFVDGRTAGVTGEPIEVRCGHHQARYGSEGRLQEIDVPCGGQLTLEPSWGRRRPPRIERAGRGRALPDAVGPTPSSLGLAVGSSFASFSPSAARGNGLTANPSVLAYRS